MKLDILHQLPEKFLSSKAEDLWQVLPGPCLIDIPKEGQAYIFLSVLLHGNEPTGLQSFQKIYKKYQENFPFSLLLLVGNIEAAKQSVRRLNGQPDFNRIWAGGLEGEYAWANQVKEYVIGKSPIWGLDIHNNTGKNPHYACINNFHPTVLKMAGKFSDAVVFFETPIETLSVAMSPYFPILTLEAGLPGEWAGIEKCVSFIDCLLNLKNLEELSENPRLQIFQVYAKMLVSHELDIFVGESPEEDSLSLVKNLEDFNFQEVSANTLLGRCDWDLHPVEAFDPKGNNITESVLSHENGELRLKEASVPSMLSSQPNIIKQDCLGYLMKEIKI